jgi:hypothetical protein
MSDIITGCAYVPCAVGECDVGVPIILFSPSVGRIKTPFNDHIARYVGPGAE